MSEIRVNVARTNTAAVKLSGFGPAGPPGPAGSIEGFVHTQSSPSSTWTVNHNLGVTPVSVTCVTVGGLEVDCAVHHVSVNQTVLSFASALAGSARFV